MTAGQKSPHDPAALLTALSGLSGVDANVVAQAQNALADAMGGSVEHRALLEKQWTIIQAVADAVRGDGVALDATEASRAIDQDLAQARACFNVALQALRTLSDSTGAIGAAAPEEVVEAFRVELSRICGEYNK